MTDIPEDEIGSQRFEGLSALLKHEFIQADEDADRDHVSDVRLLIAVAIAARLMRERCYEDGANLGAYTDDYVNYYLGSSAAGVASRLSRRPLSHDEVELLESLLEAIYWLFRDSCVRYMPGDWAKRLSGAICTIASLHPDLRMLNDELRLSLPEESQSWTLLEDESDSTSRSGFQSNKSLITSIDVESDGEDEDESGPAILNFHQAMWLVEGELPSEIAIEADDDVAPIERAWGDQEDFESLLPAAWTARRTDDWSYVIPKVERLAAVDPADRFAPENRALYNALNHLLLFGGDGQHPLAAIGQLLSQQEEFPHLGGFTYAFKQCWLPLLPDMWHWWRVSGSAPHERAGTPLEWVDRNLLPMNPVRGGYSGDADPMHLSDHSGAPLGQLWHETRPGEPADLSVTQHEPTVLTVEVSSYWGWMTVLRTIDVELPAIARVEINRPEMFDNAVLGFWLITPLSEAHPLWRNHVRFVTDSSASAVLSLVRDWQWQLPENDDQD